MKNAKRILMLVLAMAMLITALPVCATEDGDVTETAVTLGAPPAVEPSAPSYIPYINDGTGEISENFTVTSVNVTNLYGDEIKTADIGADDSVLVSCRLKATETGKGKTIKLLSAAYNASNCLVGAEISDVLTLDGKVQDIAVYLTVSEAVANIKSYIWEGSIENLVPLSECADLKSSSVKVNSITFDGDAVDLDTDFTAEGNTYTYNETINIPVSQMVMPEIKVSTDNLAARCEVSCDKGFPLSKQGDTEAATATITVKVSLDGATKAEYKFPVSQDAPAITNVHRYLWNSSTQVQSVSNSSVAIVKEPEFDNTTISRSEYRKDSTNLGHVSTTKYSDSSTVNCYLPKDSGLYTDSVYDRKGYFLFDVSPEFIGGSIIQYTFKPTNGVTYDNYNSNPTEGSTDGTVAVDFELNRSATIYVYSNGNGTFDSSWSNDTNLGIWYNSHRTAANGKCVDCGTAQNRATTWMKKHITVDGDNKVKVEIPPTFHTPYTIVKFDDMEYPSYGAEDNSAVQSIKYYMNSDSETAIDATIQNVINPVVTDYQIEFTKGEQGSSTTELGVASTPYANVYPNADSTDSTVKSFNSPWPGDFAMYIPWKWKNDVLGGEMPRMAWRANKSADHIDKISITLDKSADVFLQLRCANLTANSSISDATWYSVKPELFEEGWKLTENCMEKFWISSRRAGKGTSYYIPSVIYTPQEQASGLTIMKHFEVPEGQTVTVNLTELGDLDEIGAIYNPIIVVKRADRPEY